ncbi:MAG: sugar ABC transporter permease [Clostridia bacterium]|nr:sugar ABC transporter permease [Clostridia bacterium]
MHGYKKRDTLSAIGMLAPVMVFFLLFIIYPALKNVWYSFTNYNLNVDTWIGIKNYTRLLEDTTFIKAFKNTCIYAFVSVLSLTTLGFLAAALLSKGFRGVKWLRMLLIFPYATSMAAVSMIWLMMYDPNNGFINKALRAIGLMGEKWLFDESLALGCLIFVNIWKNIGYCMLIYLAGINSIPEELYEAATVDGAGEATRLFRITLPMVRPVAFFVLITTMVDAFKTFEQVQIMTRGDPLYATTTIVHQIYQYGFNEFRMGYAAAMAVVLLAIVMILTLINFRLNRSNESEVGIG